MKFSTRIPKQLVIAWKEYDLNKLEAKHQYYQMIADNAKHLVRKTRKELDELKEE